MTQFPRRSIAMNRSRKCPAITNIYRDLDTQTRLIDSASHCEITGSASDRDDGCDSEAYALLAKVKAWGFDVQLTRKAAVIGSVNVVSR